MYSITRAGLLAATLVAFGPSLSFAHGSFSAGEPGKPSRPARTVVITMTDDGKMQFAPSHLEVHAGEQIKFVLKNDGALKHEFMLGTAKENAAHGKMMQQMPSMVHDDENGRTVEPKQSAELLWHFSKPGTFQFACLIPGHFEAGMFGAVVVN